MYFSLLATYPQFYQSGNQTPLMRGAYRRRHCGFVTELMNHNVDLNLKDDISVKLKLNEFCATYYCLYLCIRLVILSCILPLDVVTPI